MIEELLDTFKREHEGNRVGEVTISLTDCFINSNGKYSAPKSFGELPDNQVVCYTYEGAPLLQKYLINDGKLVTKDNKPVIKNFDNDMKVISCLCVQDMRNVSLHEIREAIRGRRSLQGFKPKQIRNIEKTIDHYVPFNPEKDSAFIFAGPQKMIYHRSRLNALWMQQILDNGSEIFSLPISESEAKLMRGTFPEELLKGDEQIIKERSYMWGRPIHTLESVEFLRRKVEEYIRIAKQ